MRKRHFVALVALILVVPTLVMASPFRGGESYRWTPVNKQEIYTNAVDQTFSSSEWREVADIGVRCADHKKAVVTVSVALQGGSAPVEVRLITHYTTFDGTQDVDGFVVARPGVVPFSVGEHSDSGAFTFMANVSTSRATTSMDAQIRVPSGGEATVTAVSAHSVYEHNGGDFRGGDCADM